MRSTRSAAAAAAVAGVALLSACGGAAAGSAPVLQGRVSFYGALPDDRSSGLLVLDLATGEHVRAGDQQEAWDAAWLGPDRVAVVRGGQRIRTDGPGELVIAAADGSDAGMRVAGMRVDGVGDVREVAASDDGERMALLGRAEHSSGDCLGPAPAPMGLYLADGDGSGVRRVADLPVVSHSLALSPDGRTAAVLDRGDDVPAFLGVPRFSPDGTTLVLDGGDEGCADRDVALVDVATAAAHRVETPETAETSPVFSPDGQSLAVLRRSVEGAPEETAAIAVGGVGATDLVDVVRTGTQDEDLAWTADGSHLLVVGAVVEAACGPGVELGPECDVATAFLDARAVPVTGGQLHRVSDAVSGGQAALAAAPTT